VLTGGADGCINVWRLAADGALGPCVRTIPLCSSARAAASSLPLIRALDPSPDGRSLAVGTAACDIWEVPFGPCGLATDGKTHDAREHAVAATLAGAAVLAPLASEPELVLFGHHGELHGAAVNARREYAHIFATVSDACRVAVWSAATHKVRHLPLTRAPLW
jgi:WD40 repeat protein